MSEGQEPTIEEWMLRPASVEANDLLLLTTEEQQRPVEAIECLVQRLISGRNRRHQGQRENLLNDGPILERSVIQE